MIRGRRAVKLKVGNDNAWYRDGRKLPRMGPPGWLLVRHSLGPRRLCRRLDCVGLLMLRGSRVDQWRECLRLCRYELRAARRAYVEGQRADMARALGAARRYLRLAGGLA